MNTEPLTLEVLGPVARLTLNRPKAMNALNLATLAAFDRVLPEPAAKNSSALKNACVIRWNTAAE